VGASATITRTDRAPVERALRQTGQPPEKSPADDSFLSTQTMKANTKKLNGMNGSKTQEPRRTDGMKGKAASKASPAIAPVPTVALPFYRKSDWLAFGMAALAVLMGYLLTVAPNLTLEDSGEMAVASMYGGVPHAPGYPVWTLYTWAFTKLLPFSNIAWRVAVASAFAGALACGLIALMVSRGSGLILASSGNFQDLETRWRKALEVVSGFVAGALMGFNGFMWSQAVIVEVYTLSILTLTAVMACLFRWIYAPHQRRYLYLAWFLFGICLNNHQSLIVAALAVEFCVAVGDMRLGRDLFLGNSVCYLLGLLAMGNGWLEALRSNAPLLTFYHAVGLGSLSAMVWLAVKTRGLANQYRPALASAGAFSAGVAFYFWMPLFSMTNPPMNWAYPRTVSGFFHALTRGQYGPAQPVTNPLQFVEQLGRLALGALQEFNFLYLLIGLLPLVLLKYLGTRERGWLSGGVAFYLTLGPMLLVLLNPGSDRGSQSLVKVFFAASHVPLAMAVGFGTALGVGMLLTRLQEIRRWALLAVAIAVAYAVFDVASSWITTDLPLTRYTAVFGLTLVLGVVTLAALRRMRAAQIGLLAALCLMPVYSVMSHWWGNEQRGHMFGFWFGHDMFTPPFQGKNGHLTYARAEREEAMKGPHAQFVYPEMTKSAVLFGGTDPGRFCPTYMIFGDSFLKPEQREDPEFDRRDVYIITQNALADGHYLEYIRAHYNRSAQHDPYFFSELLRTRRERECDRTNIFARLMLPLDRALTRLGASIEQDRRERGVYPAKELQLPTNADLERCMQEYVRDLQVRAQRKQLRPGEEMRIENGRAVFSGQMTVMGINALLTREIFQKNPDHEFFVEESFPLDWMYPHLTPFGIIMKLNREPLAELGPEIVERDRRFWRDYMERLIGDWITPETNIADICNFARQAHLRRNLAGYAGDLKFLRDEQAQKSFSKLRSSISGLYDWRFRNATGQLQQTNLQLNQAGLTPEQAASLRAEQQRLVAEQTRMYQEAEFSCKQAYALCPYSPEAFQRLVNLLTMVGRVQEALAVAETSKTLDPGNSFYTNVAEQLRRAAASNGHQTRPPRVAQHHDVQPNSMNRAVAVAVANSGNILAAGSSSGTAGDFDHATVKYAWQACRKCRAAFSFAGRGKRLKKSVAI